MGIGFRWDKQQGNMESAYVSMGPAPISRRSLIRVAGIAMASVCAQTVGPVYALKPGKPSKTKLLESIRDEKSPEEIEAEKQWIAEVRKHRLERQRELQAAAERRRAGLDEDNSKDTEIESNLRGQYYFPTARKRYLPRVKLAWESIPDAESAARGSQWRTVTDFSVGVLSDAVLPMKLYASALAGGGLSISSKFIDAMTGQAESYEKALKKLAAATKKKETQVALAILSDMKGAIERYRDLGHLNSPDFGIGEIPTDIRVGSDFGNNNSSLYLRNKAVQAATSAEHNNQ